jgi:hypothetical protein
LTIKNVEKTQCETRCLYPSACTIALGLIAVGICK